MTGWQAIAPSPRATRRRRRRGATTRRTGGHITYNKTAVWLHTLERLIGWPRLQRGLSLFFTRHVFTHPTPDDCFAALSEGAGEDLTWFFDEVYRGSNTVDYGIQRFTSTAAAVSGWIERDGKRAYVDAAPGKGARAM